MEMIFIGIFLVASVFSFYHLFVSTNALQLGVSLLRAALSSLGLTAARFEDAGVLTPAVLLFVLLAILALALVRSEVQAHHD